MKKTSPQNPPPYSNRLMAPWQSDCGCGIQSCLESQAMNLVVQQDGSLIENSRGKKWKDMKSFPQTNIAPKNDDFQ